MSTEAFIAHFRFNQELAIALIEELEEIYDADEHPRAILFHLKCLVALNFYATGNYQKSVKKITHLSQSSVSRAIRDVTELCNKKMEKYIRFPVCLNEKAAIQTTFEHQGLPGVIGLIDYTQIAVSALKKDAEFANVSRKGYHTINTQIIWGNSIILAHFENLFVSTNEQKCWLLGDSGYPLQPWLLTPIARPINEAEENYNVQHKRIRSQVERVNGVWKNRFRCIIGERKLHYNPTAAAKIINATAVLHNFLILNRYSDDYSTSEDTPTLPSVHGATVHAPFNTYDVYLTLPSVHGAIVHAPFNTYDVYLTAGKEVRGRVVQAVAAPSLLVVNITD